jgi:dienelactone hydrolase
MLKARTAIISALLATALFAGPLVRAAKSPPSHSLSNSPLFLDVFRAQDVAIVTKRVEWAGALGAQHGWLVRPESTERLPALLLVAGDQTSDFLLQSARELAGVGYVVLIAELDRNANAAPVGAASSKQFEAMLRESGLAQLCSATRWIQSRVDVLPAKIGVLGWGTMARWALEVAAAQNLQAVVLVDVGLPLLIDPPLSVGLRQTAVLLVCGRSGGTALESERLANFERDLATGHIQHRRVDFKNAKPNFMESRHSATDDAKSADHAWFEIYEFLGKHVEDAEPQTRLLSKRNTQDAPPVRPAVSIADVMRAVNGPAGIRGGIAQSLNVSPREEKDWKLLRARAAVMADSGTLLLGLRPSRGDATRWQRHTASYRDAAAALAAAADRRDLADARRAFDRLNGTCGKCHADHR